MGIPVLILGQSGSGKSTGLRNFKSNEITHINVMGKPLPFKGRFAHTVNTDSYSEITKTLKHLETKIAVIDDAQYLMANEFMRRALERGYDKFTEIANNFWTLVNTVITELPYDVRVYFLMHIERSEDGGEKVKTIGKLLDEKITVEGMFTIVLKSVVKDGVYSFTTQNSGKDTVKSPLGMFDTFEIPNDLKTVDDRIYKFWDLGIPFEDSADIMAEHDAAVDNGGISTEAPAAPSRSRRSRRSEPDKTTGEQRVAETSVGAESQVDATDNGTTSPVENADSANTSNEEAPKRRTRKKRNEV